MSRDSKRRFHLRLDPLEGRQLLARVGSADFAHGLLALREAAVADANEDPGPSARIRNQAVLRAGRIGLIPKVKFPKNRGPRMPLKGNLRRQFPPRFVATQAPAQPPAQPIAPPPPVASTLPPGSVSSMEQAIVDLTNQQRVLNGLAPLTVNGKLVQAAQIHSGNMAQLDQMSHELTGVAQPTLLSRAMAVGYSYSKLGENIAYNYAGASEVVAGWMNSPGHRANLLDPAFTEIGVGVAYNSVGQPYYCQVFGRSA